MAALGRLDATPAQEREIREAWSDFLDAVHSMKSDMREVRVSIARCMRGEQMDEQALSDAFAKQDEAFEKLKVELTHFLNRVHETLDERQRDRLADFMESGRHFHFGRRGCS